jgi:hypothetical protein
MGALLQQFGRALHAGPPSAATAPLHREFDEDLALLGSDRKATRSTSMSLFGGLPAPNAKQDAEEMIDTYDKSDAHPSKRQKGAIMSTALLGASPHFGRP